MKGSSSTSFASKLMKTRFIHLGFLRLEMEGEAVEEDMDCINCSGDEGEESAGNGARRKKMWLCI